VRVTRRSRDPFTSTEHIRGFQAHLFRVRKLSGNSVAQRTAALRFLFVKTLKRTDMLEHIPFPKIPLRLPTILSQDEVARPIDSAPNLFYRTILMTLYSTGMRRAELIHLQACDIDKELMLVHIRQGKGKRDLSRKHLTAAANPLDEIFVSSSTSVRGKVKRAQAQVLAEVRTLGRCSRGSEEIFNRTVLPTIGTWAVARRGEQCSFATSSCRSARCSLLLAVPKRTMRQLPPTPSIAPPRDQNQPPDGSRPLRRRYVTRLP
jgi:integrase